MWKRLTLGMVRGGAPVVLEAEARTYWGGGAGCLVEEEDGPTGGIFFLGTGRSWL